MYISIYWIGWPEEIYIYRLLLNAAVIYNSLLTFLDIIDGRIYGPTSRRVV